MTRRGDDEPDAVPDAEPDAVPDPAPDAAPDTTLVARLRDDLEAAHFTVDTLAGLWGPEADAALFRGQRVPAVRALDRAAAADGVESAAATLARAFVLGLPVPAAALARALPTLGAEGAATLGLVALEPVADEPVADAPAADAPDADAPDADASDAGEPDPDAPDAAASGTAHPLLDLRPYGFMDAHGAGSLVLASDLGELALGHAIPETHVLGIGGASRTLSGLTVREQVDSVLDLGTGCGVQALHAARHSRHIVATDISTRALELARLNAALAGIDSIELREGSLFEPVAGERFDLIVSNPPFVITPRVQGVPSYEYRDGGLVGDDLVATVVRGAGEHLAPGGMAQLLGNWEYRVGEDGLDRVGEWTDATGLDAWVVEREVQSAEEYAETWIRDGGTRPGTAEFDRLYAAWLDDFAERGVDRVGFGYITLRRPAGEAGPSLRRLERLTGPIGTESLGEHIAASLRAHDWLVAGATSAGASSWEARLADARLTLAGDVTEERHYWPGDEHPTVMSLRQGGAFARTLPLDTGLAAVVGACDGDLTVSAIVGAVAQILEVDAEALLAEIVPSIRELVFTGILLHD